MKPRPFSLQKLQKSHKKRKTFLFLLFFLGFVGGMLLYPRIQAKWNIWNEEKKLEKHYKSIESVEESTFADAQNGFLVPDPQEETLTPEEEFFQKIEQMSLSDLPEEKILAVPFICQNPFQDSAGWEMHEESCEEAALLEAYLYTTGETVSAQEAHEIILDMIAWQEKEEHFGEHKDLYGKEMKQFIEEYYELDPHNVVHVENLDTDKVKKIINLGYPVIAPIKGELLQNPFYPYPGYHMLTIVGYSGDTVITNDVGTKRGEKYPYTWERLFIANTPVGNDGFVILSAVSSK